MNVLAFILEIRKRKTFYIVSSLIVFAASLWIMSCAFRFTSTARFMVSGGDVIDLNMPQELRTEASPANETNMNRMFIFLRSNECLDHMIREFSLYAHYDIDSARAYAYEKISRRLNNSIDLNIMQRQNRILELTVKDKDRLIAMNMANEIVAKLNRMNREFLHNQLKRKLVVYGALDLNANREMARQKSSLDSLVRHYKGLLDIMETNRIDVEALKFKLMEISQQFSNRQREIMQLKELFTLLSHAIENDTMDSITLVNKALPDMHSAVWSKVGPCLLIAFFYLCVALFLTWLYLENKTEFETLLFGRRKA